jgi:hypothetical protein
MVKRPGHLTVHNQGAVLIVGGLILFKYIQFLRLTALDLSKGSSPRLEVLLAAIFLAWMFPLAGNAQFGAPRRSTHLPFSFPELYLIRFLSPFVTGRSWVILAASVGLCYWLLYTRHPVYAFTAIVLFVAFSYFCGLAAADLMAAALGRRSLIVLSVVGLLGAVAASVLAGPGAMLLMRRVSLFLPPHLVGRILLGEHVLVSVALLSLFTIGAWALSIWATRSSLRQGPLSGPRSSSGFFLSILPGKFAGLIAKDFRHFRRLPDLYFAILVVLAAGFYLVTSPEPEVAVLWPFFILYFMSNSLAPFNFFGADDALGFDRYMLMPLTGPMITVSKNLAYLLLVVIETVPLIGLAAWRMGPLTGALSLMEVAGMMFGYMAWGNWISIAHPRRLRFFRFSSDGPLADILLGIVFGSLPGVVGMVLAVKGNNAFPSVVWQMALMLIASLLLYLGSLFRFGRSIEQRRESIKVALS